MKGQAVFMVLNATLFPHPASACPSPKRNPLSI